MYERWASIRRKGYVPVDFAFTGESDGVAFFANHGKRFSAFSLRFGANEFEFDRFGIDSGEPHCHVSASGDVRRIGTDSDGEISTGPILLSVPNGFDFCVSEKHSSCASIGMFRGYIPRGEIRIEVEFTKINKKLGDKTRSKTVAVRSHEKTKPIGAFWKNRVCNFAFSDGSLLAISLDRDGDVVAKWGQLFGIGGGERIRSVKYCDQSKMAYGIAELDVRTDARISTAIVGRSLCESNPGGGIHPLPWNSAENIAVIGKTGGVCAYGGGMAHKVFFDHGKFDFIDMGFDEATMGFRFPSEMVSGFKAISFSQSGKKVCLIGSESMEFFEYAEVGVSSKSLRA